MPRETTRLQQASVGLAIALALSLAASGPAQAQRTSRDDRSAAEGAFDRTLNVTGPVDLDVRAGSGSITIRTGDARTVQVHGRIRAGGSWMWGPGDADQRVRYFEQNPPIEQQGNVVRIGYLGDSDWKENVSLSYEIVVPAETSVRSRNGSGSQTIDGVRRSVEAGSGSGTVRVTNVGGDVRASAGSGEILIGPVAGDVEARTGSGDVMVRAAGGDLNIRTGSGSIEADGQPQRAWRLQASSGSILVRLPADAAFDITARTGSGRIDSRHPVTVLGTFGRRQLTGKVRGGGFTLDLTTSSGSIRID